VSRVAPFLGGALIVIALAGCGGTKQTPPTTTPVTGTTAVRVYFLVHGRVQPVRREAPKAAAAGGWQALSRGPTPAETRHGLSSSVAVAPGWKLVTESDGALSLTTVDQPRPSLAQIVYTLSQFGTSRVVVVDGERYRRTDFEAETPAILVEFPLPFQTVPRHFRMTGTANTFEATFQYVLVDAAGAVVARHFVIATSGSGTRGTFDVRLSYPAGHAGQGTLVVYENSAANGSRIHVVEIPVRLTG
jgi:germination protein M